MDDLAQRQYTDAIVLPTDNYRRACARMHLRPRRTVVVVGEAVALAGGSLGDAQIQALTNDPQFPRAHRINLADNRIKVHDLCFRSLSVSFCCYYLPTTS